ncbi:MAG: xylulokinase [Dehalococcoidia bacterium]
MRCVLGIDIGTTGARVLLLADTGEVISSDSSEYPISIPRPNWAEQQPDDWWQATVTATESCLEKARTTSNDPIEIEAIGITGQMHSAVFLDSDGKVLRPAILWCDQRTEPQCHEITDIVGFDRLISYTSNKALAGFTAPKMLWLRENEPQVYERVHKVLLAKDYIRYKLTGGFATEVSDASGTLLFDVVNRKWSQEMLQALRIPREWLPDCYESTDITGYLSQEAASILGLKGGIPVVGGGGDQAAGAVGNGIVHEGLASCVLGTSGVVFWHSDEHVCDPHGRLHSFCHAVPGKWHLMGVTLSAGGSLRWFRDTLCQQEIGEAGQQGIDEYEAIISKAGGVVPGSEGLLFLPYLAGERTPYADANARGAFLGLSLRHTRDHMARAVLEGIVMSLKDCLELGREIGLEPQRINLSGGGARSDMWSQMIADIFGLELVRTGSDEGPAYGAAILAGVGAGIYSSVEEACGKLVFPTDSKTPNPAIMEIYRDLYGLYKPLYATLREHFERGAKFVPENPG